MKKGIDVSAYQQKPDWRAVKASGVEFAMLRVANSKGLDNSFEHNYMGCRANNVASGVYRYSYAMDIHQAAAEAREIISILADRPLELGVWLDLEWEKQRKLPKQALTDIARAFITVIESAGYECGIYCNVDWYKNVLDTKALPYAYWVARYGKNQPMDVQDTPDNAYKPVISGDLFGWQYNSKGAVPGILGNVDLNEGYYTAVDNKPVTPPTATNPYAVKVVATGLNIRDGAGAVYNKIGSLPKGAKVTILEERSGWGRIDDCSGWINLSYTKIV